MMKKKFYTTPSVLVVDIEVENLVMVNSPLTPQQSGNNSGELGDNGEDEEFGAGSYRSTIWK